jgi:hypothetical protein
MKINYVQTIIALLLSLLISYGFYSLQDFENRIYLALGSFVFFATTLVMTIGSRFESHRTTTNIRVVSGIFFTLSLISNLIFVLISFSITSYVIINGIFLLLFILSIYSIFSSRQ